MPRPKPMPLQSRLRALLIATYLAVVLCICAQPNHFAYAAEIPVPEAVQHSEFEASIPPALPDDPPLDTRDALEEEDTHDAIYMPDFEYFDRNLIGRQEDNAQELKENQAMGSDIMPNTTVHFRFKKSQLSKRMMLEDLEDATNGSSKRADGQESELEKRQGKTQLWISASTCRQPTPNVKLVTDPPPPLTLWVWTKKSGANGKEEPAGNTTFHGGLANVTLETNDDVYIGVSAPALTQGWEGRWHFEIAATVDNGFYHTYDNQTNFIFMVDTDSDSTLFITHNLTVSNSTEEVKKYLDTHNGENMPFSIYAFPDEDWSPMIGLEHSYCGLKEQFESSNNLSVAKSITTNFGGGFPKGQFNVQGLKRSTNYKGFLVLNGSVNLTIDGVETKDGGRVFQAFNWTTKADDTCQVIFGLQECSTIAYAVPSSPLWKHNDTGLISFYDTLASTYMKNFRNSLAQVACDTTSTAQYSLARTCADCERDYKAWLCSVLIPRCEDWTATDAWLHPRNVNAHPSIAAMFNASTRNSFAFNQSRNKEIDEVVKPGPYKELLPCEDLCFDIVRSCPAQLGFACPNERLRRRSYGMKDPSGKELWCNYPGAVVDLTRDRSVAAMLSVRMNAVVVAVGLVVAWGCI